MRHLCDTYDLWSFITEPKCYKDPRNPTCIDLILTKDPRSFHILAYLRQVRWTFTKMTVTVMKAFFKKFQSRIIHYREYRDFQNYAFREELLSNLLHINLKKYKEGFSIFFWYMYENPKSPSNLQDERRTRKSLTFHKLNFLLRNNEKKSTQKVYFWKIELIRIQESIQNNVTTVCLLSKIKKIK